MLHDITVENARQIVREHARPLPSESVRLGDALGRVLADAVRAPGPVPPFATSAMDGVAVRRSDCESVPVTLPVVGASWAGQPFSGSMPPGTAVEIATGAVVPSEADAIVPVEWTQVIQNGTVTIERTPDLGHAVRPQGSAMMTGMPIGSVGIPVTPALVCSLATVGAARIDCVRQPRVRILVTGDELVRSGQTLGPGQIYDANGPTLSAHVRMAGGLPEAEHVNDEPGSLTSAFDSAADLVILSGGVSVGERDRVQLELADSGVEWVFWRVMQRPGRPLLFGQRDGVPIIGLPGNPVSASVCFEVYVRPLLAAMQGIDTPRRTERARLGERLGKAEGLHTFARVVAVREPDGILELRSAGHQASHAVLSLLGDGLAHLPAEWAEARPGAEVDFEPFPWSPPPCSSAPSA